MRRLTDPPKRKPSGRSHVQAAGEESGSGRSGQGVAVVGLGASAGGFEALEAFFGAVPAVCGLAFVVVLHLDRDSPSRVPQILQKWTAMPVANARDGATLLADHVYVIPPDRYVEVRGGRLRVGRPDDEHDRRFPVDRLFRSLGEEAGEQAMAVVLSGSGSDGALGLKSVADAGGLVLAQEPQSARFAGMPQAAIATGLVAHVAAAPALPQALLRFARRTPAVAVRDGEADPDALLVDPLLGLVRQQTRFDLSIYKRSTLARRIRRRMSLCGIASPDAYAQHLAAHPEETRLLLRDMLIGVTDFFRDPEAWAELARSVIAPLVAAKGELDAIRAWVPGTATGEEAYSLAMLILDEVRRAGKHCPVQVFATDASEEALRIARAGVYPASVAQAVTPERMARYFVPAAQDGHVQVGVELRDCLLFGMHNVLADPPFSRLDLVSCRNLLIYVEPEAQRRIVALFHFALLPRGWLFLGSAETVGPLSELFEAVSRRWRVYRRVDGAAREPLGFAAPQLPSRAAAAAAAPAPPFRESRAIEFAQHVILDRFAPACVLVDADFQVSYLCGPTADFLALRRGAPSTDLLVLAREGLRARLKEGVERAVATGRTVVVPDAMVRKDEGYRHVRLTVMPTHGNEPGRRLFLVVFEPASALAGDAAPDGVATEVVRQLEEELRVTRAELDSSVRRFSVSNEQLQLANEEVIAVNEELQSTNEELESSKEELQSLNEELNAVNQQLQHKVGELEVANADLGNLLESIDIAIVCVDQDRRVKWFTPAVRHLLPLVDADIGRPISDFARPLTGARLMPDLSAVLYRGRLVQRELRAGSERWLLRRMAPYRTAGGAIAGAVISFADITQSKRAADAAMSEQREVALRLEAEVRERTVQLHELARALGQTESRERERLAANLHDDLAQLLAGARLKLAALQAGRDGTRAGALEEIDALIARAEGSVRTTVFDLSPPSLRKASLLRTLEDLAVELERTYGLEVGLHDDGSAKPMDRELKETLYRAVRELLLNVVKHAGVARAEVSLSRLVGNVVRIVVSDLGKGFEWPRHDSAGQGRFGLSSIRDRLRLIGGDVRVRTEPGTGTEVVLSAPISHRRTETEA